MKRRSRAEDIISEARREKSRRFVLRAVVVLILAAAVAASFYYKQRAQRIVELEKQVEQGNAAQHTLEEENQALRESIKARELLAAEATLFPVEGVRVRNMNGSLIVDGQIRNMSRWEAGDIELTLYLVDRDMNVLLKESFTATSMDGEPLSRGQRRYFKHTVVNPPSGATDVIVLITDLDVARWSAEENHGF
ncbi:MAG: hypothetical protein P8Y66_11695 [Nitrospirota bacterium]|jgi:outer membrane murein-binding lipoprotein Lpp